MEQIVSSGIVDSYFKKLKEHLSVDVAIAGGGPSGMIAAYYLAKEGVKIALFERNLSPGGGMWGGAMMFNEIMVQKEVAHILDELNITYQEYENDYCTIDSVHATSSLIYHASKAGAKFFNCTSVEDVVLLDNKVSGVVINWTPIEHARWHVDPLIIKAKAVLDATGHDCYLAKTLEEKNDVKLNTQTGNTIGESSIAVDIAERTIVKNTKEVYPGLYVSGMACNGVCGGHRMGPIFGGMLLSGKKIAEIIIKKLND